MQPKDLMEKQKSDVKKISCWNFLFFSKRDFEMLSANKEMETVLMYQKIYWIELFVV